MINNYILMEQATLIKIFLASPNDVKQEREMIFALKDELNHILGKPNKIRFEFVNWERNAYPGIGEDSQDVINKAIGDDYDIFLGIFWQRFGTPTSRSESGTNEEFDRAYKKFKGDPTRNHIMIYFKTAPPSNIYDLDFVQFQKVKEFKEDIQNKGVLYYEFEKTEDLKSQLLLHLSSLTGDKYSKNQSLQLIPEKAKELDKYELLASEIDSGKLNQTNIDGILEITELVTNSMNALPAVTTSIINILKGIGQRFKDKTDQIHVINRIKDNRLRIKKGTEIVNKLAIDLDEYAEQINLVLPDFSGKLNTGIESYTKLLFIASESAFLRDEVASQLHSTFPLLYESIGTALEETYNFIETLSKLPIMTSRFGTAKRNAELATNGLLKEFIKSRKIMDQLIDGK